jgi:hypothetical protein
VNIYQLLKSLGLSSGQQPEIGYTDLLGGDYATEEAKLRFPDDGRVGGNQDAFRHLVWQANLQREMPLLAKFAGNAHESDYMPFIGAMLQGQGESEKEMDLYNNALGRKIADQATSIDDVYSIAEQMVRNNRVRTVPQEIIDAEHERKMIDKGYK